MFLPKCSKSDFGKMLTNSLFVYETAVDLYLKERAEKLEAFPFLSKIINVWEEGREVSMQELHEAMEGITSKEEMVIAMRLLIKRNLELKKENLELEKQASKDFLTGLDNRNALNEKLPAMISRLERQKPPGKMAVFMIDIDHFKKVNDTLGHHMGDIALKKMAEILKKSLRKYDIVARYGGEEFVMAVEANKENAMNIAEKLRYETEKELKKCMKENCKNEKQEKLADEMAGTISIGISFYDAEKAPEIKPDELIRQADKMLYEAKKTRNSWEYYKANDNV